MRKIRERLDGVEEIGVVELVQGVWGEKWLMFAVGSVIVMLAVAFVFFSVPQYEAKVYLQPPTHNDIASLNYGRGADSSLELLKVKDVYEIYIRHLNSESLKRAFFQSVYLPSLSSEEKKGSRDALFTRFSSALTVAKAGRDDPTRFSVSAVASDGARAAEWVKAYASRAGQMAEDELIKNLRSDASVKAETLRQQIEALRESAQKEREDQIVQLEEALRVAQSIDLEKPLIISASPAVGAVAGIGGGLTYMRGAKAIEAEIENLKARKSDDSFIERLRQQQVLMAYYASFDIKPESVTVFRQDGVVEIPDDPVKPRKVLIIVMGLLLAAASAVFLAMLSFLWKRSQMLRYGL